MKRCGLAAFITGAAILFALPNAALAQGAVAVPDPAQKTGFALQSADASRNPGVGVAAPRYFIEFRSRSALSYGHTFAVFGRTGERLTKANVAGLHPRGDSAVTYLMGHILPVESETGASDGDLESQYVTARYRIALTARQYATLMPKIRELQARSPVWNAVVYNCNAFVGDIAHLVGLHAPPPWMLPEDYINAMRALNESGSNALARQSSIRH